MNYEPNTINWQIGDLVIHDADHKSDDMIMRVVGRTRDGQIKTKYLGPDHRWKNKIWTNPKEALHDPDRFGIPIPQWSLPPTATPSASEASPPATAPAIGPGADIIMAHLHLKYKGYEFKVGLDGSEKEIEFISNTLLGALKLLEAQEAP